MFVELPGWLENEVWREDRPILIKNDRGEWCVVFKSGDTTDWMLETAWKADPDRRPVLRLWNGTEVEYATAI